jgi:hypothetical protein
MVIVGRRVGALGVVKLRKRADDLVTQGVGGRKKDVAVIAAVADAMKRALHKGAGEVAGAAFARVEGRRAVIAQVRIDVARVAVVGAELRQGPVGDGDAGSGEAERARAGAAGIEGVAGLVDGADMARKDDPAGADARAGVRIGRAERITRGFAVRECSVFAKPTIGARQKPRLGVGENVIVEDEAAEVANGLARLE